MPSIFTLFAFSFLALLIILITGKLFFYIFGFKNYLNLNFYSKFFFEIISGLIVIVVLKSIVTTSFQTINLLFLLLPLEYLLYKFYHQEKIKVFSSKIRLDKKNLYKYFNLFALFLIIGLLNALYLYSFKGSFKLPDEDLFYYSRLSNALGQFGNENMLFSYNQVIDTSQNGIVLYHYFDLWLNTFFYQLFNFSPFLSLYFIVFPILIFTFQLGVISLWEKIGNVNFLKILISIIFLFVFGLYFEFYKLFRYMLNTIPLLTDTMPFTYYGRKLLVVSIFALLVLNFLWDKKYHQAIQFLLFTTVVYSSGTFLGILGSFSFLLVIYFVFRKRLKIDRIQNRSLIFTVVFMFSFVIFTYLNRQIGFSDGILKNSLLYFTDADELLIKMKSALAVVFYYSLFFVFCYSIYLIILLLNFKKLKAYLKNISVYLVVISMALLFGMFFLFVFYLDLNARQFFTNLLPFVNCFFIFVFIILIEKLLKFEINKFRKFLSITLIFLLLIINIKHSINKQKYYGKLNERYEEKYKTEIGNELSKYDKDLLIAYRLEPDWKITFNNYLFSNFLLMDFYGYTNFISNSRINETLAKDEKLYQTSELYHYLKETKDSLNYQFSFLKEKKIKLLISEKEEKDIPKENIEKLITNSREFFYVLKY